MKSVIEKIQEYAFLSGFVAAKNLPAHEDYNGVKEYAKFETFPDHLKELAELEANIVEPAQEPYNKNSPRYPYTFAADWICQAGLAANRSEASQWLTDVAESRGVTHEELCCKAADQLISYHSRIAALKGQALEQYEEWANEAPADTPASMQP
ncbi:hypothetical protein [Sulfitobacter sp. R18_1]|uniref:hypothetical protein n=1 Tax=Sulfitobacter sp. R18_1 TaxID=2821104 RepID=UPI001ADD1474|nr:hypothetical protein [Sulfitobacter sp. R18_1]MBO9428817.1 hypothetical protein [Sulfitobacter sp. R18_1]